MPLVGLLGVTLVWMETRSQSSCGLQWRSLGQTLAWMALLVGIVVGLVDPLIQPLVDQLTDTKADYSGYGPLLGNLPAAMTLVAGAWLSAAVGEELVFRAFLMHQLHALFALVPGRIYVASLTGGLVFGLMHANQGLSGIVVTGLVGALFGFAYLRSGRNLWSLVLAHGLIDTWGVMTLYLGWY
ncbi:CPBP family intramembrane glutamic endopeptidase [Stenotrophomonas rhizophila]|jgi:membrane protease YdiL (CAAX protease family)|uniref:CPBP family intramembrane glutamic endopeptidase n=1 Tax=Stenotrophomonas rhizophila TaxID=216778 RepID=UPI0010C129B3|nr:CPBP family intramembrane glutamic endopeptidase [Stenotrophomonas rhizophila]TKK10291.1 CPBP family intramembrane metalloprotease [Stenotrophomonas rhizophila]